MAGYNDTYQMIISTLMGRPVGTEIQPDNQQAYEINMLNYIRSLELLANGPLIGIAEPDTQPIQPDDAKACYIAGVAQDRTVTFQNFRDYLGQPIQITNGQMEACLVILIWNTQYWSATQIPTNIISAAEQANFYYSYNIRKTYPSVAAMNADSDNPIGTNGKYIQVGDIVSVVNTTNSGENGIYSYTGSGWQLQSSYNFNILQSTGNSVNDTMSQQAITNELNMLRNELVDLYSEITPIVNEVDKLGWTKTYSFNGTSSKANLNNPIVLSENGDSLELSLETNVPSTDIEVGYAFAEAGNSTAWRGIGIAINRFAMRFDDGTWAFPTSESTLYTICDISKIKVVYENNNVNLYSNDVLVATYEGQKTITINVFGYKSKGINYYWDGIIKEIKVNDINYDLLSIATLTDVILDVDGSFLTPEEKNTIDDIGDLSQLETEDKDSLVDAINETAHKFNDIVNVGEQSLVHELTNFADDIFFGTWQKVEGGISADGSPSTLASNYRFEISLTQDISIYFDISVLSYTYFAFSYIKDGVQSGRTRMQKSGGVIIENTLPTYENKISLSAGDTIYISVSKAQWETQGDSKVIFGIEYVQISGSMLNPNIKVLSSQVIGGDIDVNTSEMFVKKTETEIDVYLKRANGDFVKYPIVHAQKAYQGQTTASAFYDCWGITEPCLATLANGVFTNGMVLFYQSEAELTSTPPNYLGNAMAVGGDMHGYENIINGTDGREFLCLINNTKIGETSLLELSPASEVDIQQHTYLYQVGTNTDPYAIASKRWLFKDGTLRLTVSLKFIREISVTHIYSSLMGVLRNEDADPTKLFISSSAIKENQTFKVYDVSSGSYTMLPDKNCKKITLYGQAGVGFSDEIIESNMADSGGMFISHNNNPYNKIYFQIVGTLLASVDDEYHATSEWRIL